MITPPKYECVIHTKDKSKGIELINQALKKIDEVITAKGGKYKSKSEPKIVGEKEEQEEGESTEERNVVMSDEDEDEGMDADIQSKFIKYL